MPHKIRFFFRTSIPHGGRWVEFLDRLQAESPELRQLRQTPGEISLIADGEEAELAALAEKVGREVPLSIFLSQSGITAATDDEPAAEPQEADDLHRRLSSTVALPPCPRCLHQAEEDFQAGRAQLQSHCRLCQTQPALPGRLQLFPANGELRWLDHLPADQPSSGPDEPTATFATLAQAAQLLAAGQKLRIFTPAGTTEAAITPDKLDDPGWEVDNPSGRVLVTIPGKLPEFWQCEEEDVRLLAAWEKPLLLLEPTTTAQQRYQLPPRPRPVGLADNLFYWHLARHLQQLDFPLLFLAEQPPARPLTLISRHHRFTWLLNGGSALFPLTATLNPAPPSRAPDRRVDGPPPNPPGLQADGRQNVTIDAPPDPSPWRPELARQVFKAFLATTPEPRPPTAERENFFGLSLSPDPGGISLWQDGAAGPRLLPVIEPHRPQAMAAVLAEIGAMDAGADRLLHNFAHSFPQRWQRLQNWPQTFNPTALHDIWLALLLIVDASSERPPTPGRFLALAAHRSSGRSPLLTVGPTNGPRRLDHRRLLRSALSYTMADAPPAAICRGLMESLAELLTQLIWETAPPANSPRVALATPLCLHPAFYQAFRSQGGDHFLLPPPPVPLDCLPAIGLLRDQSALASGASPSPDTPPTDHQRRDLLKAALGLRKFD